MARLNENDIAEIKKVYAETGSYAETARRLHRSAATVKKYVSGETSSAKTRQAGNLICIDNFNQEMLAKVVEPLPIEEIEIPDDFRSWTTLTTAERDFMALNYFSGKSE